MPTELFTAIGMFGVLVVISAYALLATGKLAASDVRYQWLNVVGTAGILISLIAQWNMAAFIANSAWITIGIVALLRIYRARGRA